MELVLESVFAQRSAQLAARLRPRRNFLLSLALHVILVLAVLVGPLLLRKKPQPLEFTPITIVPVQALGVQEPVPAAPAPRQEKEPAKPEPIKTEPEPVERQPEADTPALPMPDEKKTVKPAPQPESKPTATQTSGTETTPDRLGQRKGSPTGSTLGTSAFGAAVGGLDNPDFVYGYYVDQMLAMIGTNWNRPPLGAEVEAVIHFRIHRDGHISDVRVLQSSGYNTYDLAGLRAIQLAAPFPRLPQSFKHSSLGVNLILR